MSDNQIEQNQNEKLQSQFIAADLNPNRADSSNLVENHTVDNTPFNIIGDKEHGYLLRIGRFRLSDRFETKEAVVQWMNDNEWTLITNLILTLITADKEFPQPEN